MDSQALEFTIISDLYRHMSINYWWETFQSRVCTINSCKEFGDLLIWSNSHVKQLFVSTHSKNNRVVFASAHHSCLGTGQQLPTLENKALA